MNKGLHFDRPEKRKMSAAFTPEELETIEALQQGDASVQTRFFEDHKEKLKLMVRLRIDRRLQRRVDDSDIMQEAFLEFRNRTPNYLASPQVPPVVWLRRLVRQVISRYNRDHLGAQCRDVRREMYSTLSSSSVNIDMLSASLSSIHSTLAKRELRERLATMVKQMSPFEREILLLVHFEGRTVREASEELDINLEAAKKRYRRALKRLREVFQEQLVAFEG